MRKLKTIKTNIQPKFTEEEVIFFGIVRVCLHTITNYLGLLEDKDKIFSFHGKNIDGAHSPLKILKLLQETLKEIVLKTEKQTWSDVESIKIKNKLATYFEVVESTVGISTRKEIEEQHKIYLVDYEIISTLINGREFFKELKNVDYLSEEIQKDIKKSIPKVTEFVNFMLNEIWFGNPPDPKKARKREVVEMEVVIDEDGKLINKQAFYDTYEIKDEENNMFIAGITKEGFLYVMNSDDQNYILNSMGKRTIWMNTLKKKRNDSMGCMYQVGGKDIVTNIRRHNFELLLKECNRAGIENIEIVRTLIEMQGYSVERSN